jgi:RNA polymerase sigma-70 factor, ECF subfamily
MEAALASVWVNAGRAAWPSLPLDPVVYVAFLDERAGVAKQACAGDLYLACALLHSVPGALEAFDALMRSAVRGPALRIDPSPGFVDDVLQVLREMLLMASATRGPGLAAYDGRAELRLWLKTAAARAALNLRRSMADAPHDSVGSQRPAASSRAGAERDYAKEQYRRAFHEALRIALATIPPRDRELLALHLVDGATLVDLAQRAGKDRATIARWLASARTELFEATKREMCRRLGVPETDFASVAAFVRSRLGDSVVELLRAGSG